LNNIVRDELRRRGGDPHLTERSKIRVKRDGCDYIYYLVYRPSQPGCRGERHTSGGPYYFATWYGYSLPRRPGKPISFSEATKRRAYIEAYYDEEGRLARITKYLDGKIAWTDSYQYRDGKLIRRTGRKANGEEVHDYYDK